MQSDGVKEEMMGQEMREWGCLQFRGLEEGEKHNQSSANKHFVGTSRLVYHL